MSVQPTTSRRAVVWPLITAAGLAAAALAMSAVISSGHSLVMCPLRALTGLACPLCGGTRATADLLHGDIAAAWAMNPLWVATIPLLAVFWVDWLRRSWRGQGPRPLSDRTLQGIAVVVVVFAVVRNLPGMSAWLGPA